MPHHLRTQNQRRDHSVLLVHSSRFALANHAPGSLSLHDTLIANGSLTSFGTLGRVGSLKLADTLTSNGSLSLHGTLIVDGSLKSSDTYIMVGSLTPIDTLWKIGSLTSPDTLAVNGHNPVNRRRFRLLLSM